MRGNTGARISWVSAVRFKYNMNRYFTLKISVVLVCSVLQYTADSVRSAVLCKMLQNH